LGKFLSKKNIAWLYLLVAFLCFLGVADWNTIIHELSHDGGSYKRALEQVIGALDAGSAVALASLAYLAYQEMRHDDDWITVVIQYPDGREPLKVDNAFQREECSRSELQGILGGVHGSGRYEIAYMSSAELRAEIKRVKTSTAQELIIPLQVGDFLRERIEPISVADDRPLAFWNISNHPIEGWSEAQKQAALELAPEAELVDVAFPSVSPEWGEKEVVQEAKKVAEGWKSALAGERRVSCAMVAGEPTMCVLLVRELQALGVSCYNATTERVVAESEGEKRSRFTFVRFRAWPVGSPKA
jgi:hypothetical protein